MRRRTAFLVAALGLGAGTSAAVAGVLPLPSGSPLCLMSCAPPPPPPPPAPSSRVAHRQHGCHPPAGVRERPARADGVPLVGLNAGLRFARGRSLCTMALRVRRSGARIVREDISWGEAEPSPGHYRWGHTDELIGVAARYGLTVLPLVRDVPSWEAADPTTIPARPNAYAGFIARLVARYGPDGRFWLRHPALAQFAPGWFELWNEPFLPQFSAGRPDPARYARLVRATVQRARAANPLAKYLIAGETAYDAPEGSSPDWTESMYRAVPDLGRYFDAIAVHPYSARAPDTSPRAHGSARDTSRLERIRATMVAHGDGAKPLWITEIGWSTCGRAPACVGVAQQAYDLRALFRLVRTRWTYVHAVAVYTMDDYPAGADAPPKETSFGLIGRDGRAKPSYRVFERVAAGR